MDSSAPSHQDLDLHMNGKVTLSCPPDINLPLSAERSPPPQPWNPDPSDTVFDIGLGTQGLETESFVQLPKVGRKCAKRLDSIWGAWFFFRFYFKPALVEKSKAKVVRDSNGVSGFDKSDIKLDVFMVQHDMENMYMWVFKEKPENALGEVLLREMLGAPNNIAGAPSNFYEWAILPFNKKL